MIRFANERNPWHPRSLDNRFLECKIIRCLLLCFLFLFQHFRPESSLGLLHHTSLFPKLNFVQSLPALGEEEVHKTFDDENVDGVDSNEDDNGEDSCGTDDTEMIDENESLSEYVPWKLRSTL